MPKTPLTSKDYEILDMLALSSSEVEDINVHTENSCTVVYIELKRVRPACSRCGHMMVSNGFQTRTPAHSVLTSRNCVLHIRKPRWKCPFCRKTSEQKVPFAEKNQKLTMETVNLILDELRSHLATYTRVGQRYGISSAACANLFDRYIQYPEATTLPRVLLIDEVYAYQSNDSRFICMMLDMEKQIPVDILQTRKKEFLIQFFAKIPLEERKKVEFFCSDMYDTYQDVAKQMLPNAKRAVDRYHVSEMAHRTVQAIRLRFMKSFKTTNPKYYLLKHHNRLLQIHPDDRIYQKKVPYKKRPRTLDPNLPKIHNKALDEDVNDYDLLCKILEISPDLSKAYEISCAISELFDLKDLKKAREKLLQIIRDSGSSGVDELEQLSDSLTKWFEEILNSFTVVYKEIGISGKSGKVYEINHRLTSSLIENRNNIIQTHVTISCGYRNWIRFRNRLLYVLKKEPPSGWPQTGKRQLNPDLKAKS